LKGVHRFGFFSDKYAADDNEGHFVRYYHGRPGSYYTNQESRHLSLRQHPGLGRVRKIGKQKIDDMKDDTVRLSQVSWRVDPLPKSVFNNAEFEYIQGLLESCKRYHAAVNVDFWYAGTSDGAISDFF
jgi:hypothetical protein